MAPQRTLSDVPDFLQNSPFLPFDTDASSSGPTESAHPKPTVAQIVRSKRLRTIIIALITFTALFILLSKFRTDHPFTRLGISGPKCYFTPPVTIPEVPPGEVDWTRFAYIQYATSDDYLCNSLMLFATLERLESRADRVLLYTANLLYSSTATRLLESARADYNVQLVLVEKQHKNDVHYVWADSYTKLLAFNQTQYERVIHLDSDSTLRENLDNLFFLPEAPVVLPKAYWLGKPKLGAHIMVLQPSDDIFGKIVKGIRGASRGTYDMEIVNKIFGTSCLLLPHQPYALLTGEFGSPDPEHKAFMGEDGDWDPEMVLEQAKFVHFSDYPFPKPWEETTAEQQEKAVPPCVDNYQGWKEDCRAREIWINLYKDFKERRWVCDHMMFSRFFMQVADKTLGCLQLGRLSA
jgi:hypothetical protein